MELRATVAERERLHTSPISGEEGVFFFVEVLEDDRVLGHALFGDVVRLVIDEASYTVSVRDIRLRFAETRSKPLPWKVPPPAELVAWLQRASGQGVLGWREHVVRAGDRFRVCTPVELQASRGVILPEGGAPLLLEALVLGWE